MKTKSAKQKSRRLQDHVCAQVRALFYLSDLDVWPAIMGEGGLDIRLTRYAREYFPFAIECKNREDLNIWEALEQAETIARKEELWPVLVFKRNKTPAYAAFSLELFETMLKAWSGTWPSALSPARPRASIWTALKEAKKAAKEAGRQPSVMIRRGEGPAYVVLSLLLFLDMAVAACPALDPPVVRGFTAPASRARPVEDLEEVPSST